MKLVLVVGEVIFFAILSSVNAEAQKGWETYTVPDEYSFQYPPKWNLEERENRFSAVDARLTYGQFNDVQMSFSGGDSKTEYKLSGPDSELIDDMQTIMENNYEDVSLFENDSNKYKINNQTSPYVIGTYTGGWSTDLYSGETTPIEWAVLLVAVHLNKDQIVLAQYTTEKNDFDRYLPQAEKVIESISAIEDNNASTLTK